MAGLSDVANLSLGGLAGIAGSMVAWWLVIVSFRPRFRVGPNISARTLNDGSVRYRVKIRNSGRKNLFDISIAALLEFKGLDPALPENYASLRVPVAVRDETFPVLRAGKSSVVRLRLGEIDPGQSDLQLLSRETRARIVDGSVSLEELFDHASESRLLFSFAATQERSGVRRGHIQVFKSSDIAYRLFDARSEFLSKKAAPVTT